MPVRYIDEVGELYSRDVQPKTQQQLLGEQKVGDIPADAFPHANKDVSTDKAFNEAGPEAAENFEPSPNDSNKKKNKKSAYNEEGLSQPVVQEKSNFKKIFDQDEHDEKGKKLIKGQVDPKAGKKARDKKGNVTGQTEGVIRGGSSLAGAGVGAAGGAGLGFAAGTQLADKMGSGFVGQTIGALGGAGLGAVAGGYGGAKLGSAAGRAIEGKPAAPKGRALAKASAKPGKKLNNGKLSGKMESNQINNSTMKETNKSTFDRLFEDVMGEDFEEFSGDEGVDDIEIGGDELGGEDVDDTVTLELPRDLAEGLHAALMDQLGGGDDGLEDLEDAEGLEGDVEADEGYHESHVDLQAAPDSITKLATQNGGNNKVEGSGHAPAGGSADTSASGQGGDGSPQKAPEGFTHANTKNNKVKGKVSGGNKDLFKA